MLKSLYEGEDNLHENTVLDKALRHLFPSAFPKMNIKNSRF